MIVIQNFLILSGTAILAQQNLVWDKQLVQKVAITDQTMIKKLVFDLFIPESDIKFIEIFDISVSDFLGYIPLASPKDDTSTAHFIGKDSVFGNDSFLHQFIE